MDMANAEARQNEQDSLQGEKSGGELWKKTAVERRKEHAPRREGIKTNGTQQHISFRLCSWNERELHLRMRWRVNSDGEAPFQSW
jgi:hypothetical protein